MSARRIDAAGDFQPVTVQARETRLSLAPEDVRIRRNGVEFRSASPIAPWTEMTVTLQSTREAGRVHSRRGAGVVAVSGGRHSGYTVSMGFLQGCPRNRKLA